MGDMDDGGRPARGAIARGAAVAVAAVALRTCAVSSVAVSFRWGCVARGRPGRYLGFPFGGSGPADGRIFGAGDVGVIGYMQATLSMSGKERRAATAWCYP
jgi:hypothetical protein